MTSVHRAASLVGALLVTLVTSARAEEVATPQCFDAVVKARVLRETPTAAYDCGPDCIVISWPWIVEFDVGRVLSGHANKGRLTVLTVQHMHTLQSRKYHPRWLRRNTLGTFNVLSVDPYNPPPQCAADAPPARPYIQPPDGKTLLDLEREGAELSRGSK
jgi:hypothetical protein